MFPLQGQILHDLKIYVSVLVTTENLTQEKEKKLLSQKAIKLPCKVSSEQNKQ